MGVLDEIVAIKRQEVSAARRRGGRAGPPSPRVRRHDFAAALAAPGIRIIAEVKKRSPSEPDLNPGDDVLARAAAYARGGAAALSVLTDPHRFGGSLADLEAVAGAVDLPILRKDFVVSALQIEEAAAAGANAVLLIAAALDRRELAELMEVAAGLGLAALVEVHDEAECDRALELGARLVGINNRDLRTLEIDLAVSRRLLPRLPAGVVGVVESGIKAPAEVRELAGLGARAFLIGSTLMRAADPAGVLAALRGV